MSTAAICIVAWFVPWIIVALAVWADRALSKLEGK